MELHVLLPFMQEPSSVEKIMEIDEHIGCAMSGLIADARTLVEHARVETQVIITIFISFSPFGNVGLIN